MVLMTKPAEPGSYTRGQVWGALRKAWKGQPESKWTWLAALVDGEGSLSIYISNNKTLHGSPNRVLLSITNTNLELLQLAKEAIGEGWITHKNYRTEGYRDIYLYQCGSRTLRWLLPKIAPYLVVKRNVIAPIEEFLQVMYERMGGQNATRGNHKLMRVKELKQEVMRANERI